MARVITPRERKTLRTEIVRRYKEGATFVAIGDDLNLSRETVRTIFSEQTKVKVRPRTPASKPAAKRPVPAAKTAAKPRAKTVSKAKASARR
jgi:DNA-directed RNA polymerase sigma subunit (sigma70/sigma32)